ncbi:MAG: dihydrodipicolinate synthase family protein [Alphaproteobacteria bacterium]
MAPSSQLKEGVYAAALTPLTAKLEPDLPALTAHFRWLLENGCDGIAPLGTTGEANSLSLENRTRIIEAVASADIAPSQVIVGTGSCAIGDTVKLTKLALSLGFSNVLVLPPFYYKDIPDDGLFSYFATLIEQVGDPDLRIFLYHFPKMSAMPISFDLVKRLRGTFGEVVAGLKDSSGDWENTSALLAAFPGFKVFSGSEEFLADNLQNGGPGCISATVNVTAKLAAKVMQSAGENRLELQRQLTQIRVALQRFPMVPVLKCLMHWHTGRDCWNAIVPPLTNLSQTQAGDLRRQISALDFFQEEFVCKY